MDILWILLVHFLLFVHLGKLETSAFPISPFEQWTFLGENGVRNHGSPKINCKVLTFLSLLYHPLWPNIWWDSGLKFFWVKLIIFFFWRLYALALWRCTEKGKIEDKETLIYNISCKSILNQKKKLDLWEIHIFRGIIDHI